LDAAISGSQRSSFCIQALLVFVPTKEKVELRRQHILISMEATAPAKCPALRRVNSATRSSFYLFLRCDMRHAKEECPHWYSGRSLSNFVFFPRARAAFLALAALLLRFQSMADLSSRSVLTRLDRLFFRAYTNLHCFAWD
jgi:hypothetical protein